MHASIGAWARNETAVWKTACKARTKISHPHSTTRTANPDTHDTGGCACLVPSQPAQEDSLCMLCTSHTHGNLAVENVCCGAVFGQSTATNMRADCSHVCYLSACSCAPYLWFSAPAPCMRLPLRRASLPDDRRPRTSFCFWKKTSGFSMVVTSYGGIEAQSLGRSRRPAGSAAAVRLLFFLVYCGRLSVPSSATCSGV